MLSQGQIDDAPLYWCTCQVQVGPRFGNSGLLVEWEQCHNMMVEDNIHLGLLSITILDLYKLFGPLVCFLKGICVNSYRYTGQVGPRFGNSGSLLEWKWWCYVMFEAFTYLRPFKASILDTYKVFELLVRCIKGIWVHSYDVTPAKFARDLGNPSDSELVKWKSCHHSVMFEADIHFRLLQLYRLDILSKRMSQWCAVSRVFRCPLVLLHRPSWPQIWGFGIQVLACQVKMMSLCHVWGLYPPQTTSFIQIRYTKCLSHWYDVLMAFRFTLTQLHWPNYWSQIWKLWVACRVKMMSLSFLRLISTLDPFPNPYKTYTKKWAIVVMLSQGHMDAPLYCYTSQVGPRFGNSGVSLVEWE